MSTVKFSSKAFKDPTAYIDRQEDEADIERYTKYMKGLSRDTHEYFKVLV